MAGSQWDLGKLLNSQWVSPGRSTDDTGDPVEEVFEISNYKNGVVVRAIRPADLVDIRLKAYGYRCIGLGSGSTAQNARLSPISSIDERRLWVTFAPQHIAEQIMPKPDGENGCQSAADWGAMRVRASGESRLVFDVPKSWQPGIKIAELTDWSDLQPVVHRRASSLAGADVEAQLKIAFPGIAPQHLGNLKFAEAIRKIADGFVGPADDESALEMAGRLILSPSERGRWIVPPGRPDPAGAPLWTARLDRTGRSSVRAIWSTRMKPGVLPKSTNEPAGDTGKGQPMLALNYRNHWEIVAETSVYGLPALRRLPVTPADPFLSSPSLAEENGPIAQVVAPAPHGDVVRPPFDIGFLNEIDKGRSFANLDSGIATATPFADADIHLTALGGIFGAEWKGDPAGLLTKVEVNAPSAFADGFSLERLSYRSWLGRDSRVVAVEKGFLFPLGIRASLVTVHERNIYPDAKGNPVSYLISRKFIVTPRRPRSYPGPYHPYEGRQFPPRRITMQTLVTPDLAPIQTISLPVENLPEGSVFWPQVKDAKNAVSDVVFKWSTEDAVTVRSKLIFVRNDAIRIEAVMAALVAHYNHIEPDARRLAALDGARHGYAASKQAGDTSFDTATWLLAAEGRRDGPGGSEHFALDGRMEGADQPPFYPVMKQAQITVQTIDQLIGQPQGLVKVEYFREYVEHGFLRDADGKQDKHGIFLKLSEPVISLPASSNADRGGGLASPDLLVAALSRKTGLVGGTARPKALSSSEAGINEVEIDFSEAAKGKFDPKQFFSGAKLLGVVKLEDLVTQVAGIAGAPQLIEQVQQGAREIFEKVRTVAKEADAALYGAGGNAGAIISLKAGIDRANGELKKASLTLAEVYPSLMDALAPALDGRLHTALSNLINAAGPEEAREPIASVIAFVKPLLTAAIAVIKDPVPDAFEGVLERVRKFFDLLLGDAAKTVSDLIADITALIFDWLKQSFCDAIDKENFGHILFGELGNLSCSDLFKDPRAALRAFGDGLFGAALDRMLEKIEPVLADADALAAKVDAALDQLRGEALSAINAAVGLIEDRLADLDPMLDDLRTIKRRTAFAVDLMSGVRMALAAPDKPSPEQALEFAKQLDARVRRELSRLIDEQLAGLLGAIHPKQGEDAAALLAELSDVVRKRLSERLIDPLAAKVKALRERLERVVPALAQSGFAIVRTQISELFEAVLASSEIVAIARAARKIQEICDKVGEAALTLGDTILAPADSIAKAAQAVLDTADLIAIPPGNAGAALRIAISAIRAAALDIIEQDGALRAERERLAKVATDMCATPADRLDPVAAILRLRRALLGKLLDVARQAEAIAAAFTVGTPSQQDKNALKTITRGCADLCLQTSGASGFAKNAPQKAVAAAVQSIVAHKVGTADFEKRLTRALDDAVELAGSLQTALNASLDPTKLRTIIEGDLHVFQDRLDRELAAFLYQTAGFSDSILSAIEKALTPALTALCRLILPAYSILQGLLDQITKLGSGGTLSIKAFRYALGGDKKFEAIADAGKTLDKERKKVEDLATTPGQAEIAVLIDTYRTGEGALPKAIAALQGLAVVDIGQNLTQAIRTELRRIEEELNALIRQFVPTRLETRYFWATELSQFPPGDDAWIFKPEENPKPYEPTPNPPADAPKKWHLWLDSRFSFDIVTKKREVEIAGVLRPFELRLLGAKFHMLTITFAETRFRSVNGSVPDFDMKVADVKIGSFLKYIQTLEQWLKPAGNGFYVQPAIGQPGIEAGYIYDAGIIQVGTLQFINVAFRVAAVLPFRSGGEKGTDAKFIFALASAERPFLISNPPYGGGGWVQLECNAKEVTRMEVGFVFGGVAALKFGPLNAQGRVVAGVYVEWMKADDGKKAWVFMAIFEASGEGSIACFSISVSLRITLTQRTNGALYGLTVYQFSFKCGFVRLKYKVEARYRLSNGGSEQVQFEAAQLAGNVALLRSNAPEKARQWQSYRKYFDLDLLKGAL